ncbi:MAG TPA: N-formylglutamate amidohydrolase [Alphaproteobacteria bacterium]|nr:N-formylglutamate amidohydrolase [Alphaproteobacteria bacterium]
MTFRPVTILEPSAAPVPLVVDSPHSGRIYPADFDFACPLPLLKQTEDSFVDELVAGAAQAGATVVLAEFARSYIDANRAEDDIDPALLAAPWPVPLAPTERTLLGLGLVRRLCKSGVPVYGKPLPPAEIEKRLENCYRPYHASLEKAITRRVADFGECALIDCHSMPSQSGEGPLARRPDFVLGDRDGSSCDPSLTRRVRDILQEMGYGVALNDPYKGVEIVRRHGKPQEGRQALQLEINRRLYMNEQTLEKHAGFGKLREDLTNFFAALAETLRSQIPDRAAAAE